MLTVRNGTRLPTIPRVHRVALYNAIRRADLVQVRALRGLPGCRGVGLGRGGGAWGAGYLPTPIAIFLGPQ